MLLLPFAVLNLLKKQRYQVYRKYRHYGFDGKVVTWLKILVIQLFLYLHMEKPFVETRQAPPGQLPSPTAVFRASLLRLLAGYEAMPSVCMNCFGTEIMIYLKEGRHIHLGVSYYWERINQGHQQLTTGPGKPCSGQQSYSALYTSLVPMETDLFQAYTA